MSCGFISFMQAAWPARFGCLPAACGLNKNGAMLPKAQGHKCLLYPVEITLSVKPFLA
jgi:hypothetical protein